MTKHLRFLFVTLLTLVWTVTVGGQTTKSVVCTMNKDSKECTSSSSCTVSWNYSKNAYATDINRGIQWSKPSNVVLTATVGNNSSIVVDKIVVNASTNNNSATITANVGDVSYGTTTLSKSTTNSDYEYTGITKGNILKFTLNSTGKSIYIKTITITYSENESGGGTEKTNTSVKFENDANDKTFELTEGKLDGSVFSGYTASEENGVAGKFTYKSDNNNVAAVDAATGLVTVSGYGTANITAKFVPTESDKYEGSSATYTIKNNKETAIESAIVISSFSTSTLTANYSSPSKKVTFKSDGKVDYTFIVTSCAKGGNTHPNDMKMRAALSPNGAGIAESPVFKKNFPNGYKVTLTFNGDIYPKLSSAELSSAKCVVDKTAKTVTMELPSSDATFTITAGEHKSTPTYISKIELTPLSPSLPSSGIKFNKSEDNAELKDELFSVEDLFSNENKVAVTFESSNKSVAEASEEVPGYFELKSVGTTTITAKFAGNETYKSETVSMLLNVVDSRQDAGIGFGQSQYEADASTGSYDLAVKNPNGLKLDYTVIPSDGGAEYDGTTILFPENVPTTYEITASYKGDNTYKPATATCKLVVKTATSSDNVTFIPASQKGSNSNDDTAGDEVSNGYVTISSNHAVLGNGTDYEFYGYENSEHTFSTTRGKITKIEFIGNDKKNSLNNIKLIDTTVGNITTSGDFYTAWEGDAAKVTFTTSNQASATQIIVTLALPKATDVTYSEDATNSIVACENANVTLTRTLHSGMWNTFCVPFNVDADKVKAAFGNGVQVATFNTEETTDGQVSFTLGSEIKANEPCLLMPAEEHDNVYKFENVKIVKDNDEYPYVFTLSKNSIIFAGFYSPTTLSDAASKFNEDKTTYFAAFLGANNKLYKADPASGSTNAFRAFFAISDGTDAQSLKVAINGVTTSISAIDAEQADDVNAPVYNLQGQRVDGQNLSRGIYVKNGKKFVVSK